MPAASQIRGPRSLRTKRFTVSSTMRVLRERDNKVPRSRVSILAVAKQFQRVHAFATSQARFHGSSSSMQLIGCSAIPDSTFRRQLSGSIRFSLAVPIRLRSSVDVTLHCIRRTNAFQCFCRDRRLSARHPARSRKSVSRECLRDLDGSWPSSGLRQLRARVQFEKFSLKSSEAKNLTDLFWLQLELIQPVSFISDGDLLNFVTSDDQLFDSVRAALKSLPHRAPVEAVPFPPPPSKSASGTNLERRHR